MLKALWIRFKCWRGGHALEPVVRPVTPPPLLSEEFLKKWGAFYPGLIRDNETLRANPVWLLRLECACGKHWRKVQKSYPIKPGEVLRAAP